MHFTEAYCFLQENWDTFAWVSVSYAELISFDILICSDFTILVPNFSFFTMFTLADITQSGAVDLIAQFWRGRGMYCRIIFHCHLRHELVRARTNYFPTLFPELCSSRIGIKFPWPMRQGLEKAASWSPRGWGFQIRDIEHLRACLFRLTIIAPQTLRSCIWKALAFYIRSHYNTVKWFRSRSHWTHRWHRGHGIRLSE